MYGICDELEVESPYYSDLNKITAQSVSNLTASLRFGGCLNADLIEIQTNLVPYPRIKFMLSAYSNFGGENQSICQLVNSVFRQKSMLATCDLTNKRYMACSMLFRGDINPFEVNKAIV